MNNDKENPWIGVSLVLFVILAGAVILISVNNCVVSGNERLRRSTCENACAPFAVEGVGQCSDSLCCVCKSTQEDSLKKVKK